VNRVTLPASNIRWAWSHTRSYRRPFVLIAVLSTLEIALRVATPFAMTLVVDHALGATSAPLAGRRHLLIELVIGGLALQVCHQLVLLGKGRLSVRTGQSLVQTVREKLFAHVQAWTLRHHGEIPTGDAVQRLDADARCVDQIVMRGIFPVVFSLLTLVVMFGVLMHVDMTLALLSLAVVPPMYGWLRFYARRMAPRADHARHTDSRLTSRLFETMNAIRLVKSHAREDLEHERFCETAREAAEAWIHVGHQGTVFAMVSAVLTVIGTSLVLLFGGLAVLDGRITVGTLLLIIAYLGFIYGPLSAIANTTSEMQQAFASARRVRAAFAMDAEPLENPNAIATPLRGEVRFKDVRFGYGDGRPVLDGVSFTARPGETVALVGPSGAGKSTLASLLVRFYDALGGQILIDGLPITSYELSALRQQVAIVLQDAPIVAGSVADNLRYGRLDASDEDVEKAAEAANAHDFIADLPDGYETTIGECGARLTGGQRQHLSIARAFLKDAPIVILDEPTGALDKIAEGQVVEAVDRLRKDRTTFVVAHRLSTVKDADRIIVLDGGRVAAQGTHDELLDQSPLYQQLAKGLVTSEPAAAAA
jgi:ABC-type multidrug transport system fused ATPase/permease subunit